MEWWLSCRFPASQFVFSLFFSPVCQLKSFNYLFLLAEAPINQQNNQMISVCICAGAVSASTYFCQKPTFSLHEAETEAFQMMDYDQFNKDFCQSPASDGVATREVTCLQCNIMFWITPQSVLQYTLCSQCNASLWNILRYTLDALSDQWQSLRAMIAKFLGCFYSVFQFIQPFILDSVSPGWCSITSENHNRLLLLLLTVSFHPVSHSESFCLAF